MTPEKNRITIYGFILTIFVIWLHAGESLVSSIPGQVAVPGFFIMSGCLFFQGVTEENAKIKITEKLRKRVQTLLIPYLLWNFLYYAVYLCFGKASFSLPVFFTAVFHYSCNPVFWYLFQLILITVLTPVLYFILRKRISGILFLSFVFLLAAFWGKVPFHYCNEDALFYYSLGAFYALCGKKEVPFAGALAGFTFFCLAEKLVPAACMNAVSVGLRASGAVLLWRITGFFSVKGKLPEWMKIGFFIYATHYLVIRAVWAAGFSGSIPVYFLMPVICIFTGYALFVIMKRFLPRVLSVLTGGRGLS